MTILRKLFISFFPLFLFASNISLKTEINLYSDSLYFDVFDNEWNSIPSTKSINRAINYSYAEVAYNVDNNVSFGYKYNSFANIKINKGFIETWYYADSDFNTLLKRSDIYVNITEPNIYGLLNYCVTDGVFIRKNFKNLKITLNLYRGKNLEYLKVNGNNTNERFVADLKYYYSSRNFVTHKYEDDDYYEGYGGGVDIEYENKFKNIKYKVGLYNILGFLKWKSVTYLEYHFDSDTKYIGDDGYYHYKPFGVGKYYTNVSFYQRLPKFLKYSVSYKKNIEIGDNGLYSTGARYDELYAIYKHIKLGYVPQTKNAIFGLIFRNFRMEASSDIKKHSKLIKLNLEIKFKI